MNLRIPTACLGFLASFCVASAAGDPLLAQAVENWLGERDHWAFTQRAVEFERGQPRERLERYDPSLPGRQRWRLLAINGQPPTDAQSQQWAQKKFKKNPRRFDSPIGDLFDLADAKRIDETATSVRYEVPLRTDKNWLFQADKLRVLVTVNKETRALEHLSADVREPVKVLLGLARITDGRADLSFLTFDEDAEPGPETAQPKGTAHVVVSRFGERAEFTWSEFKRVNPAAVAAAKQRQN